MEAILAILGPMLLQLFGQNICPKPAGQTAQDFLKDHQDEATGEFDPHFVHSLRPHTRRAARKAHDGRKSPAELDAITVEQLNRGVTATDEQLAACAATPIPDD